MSIFDSLDPTPPKLTKQPALVIAPIHGVLPYAGARNPLTRSNTARRVSMAFTTPHLGGQRQVFLFESELESVIALEAMLSPEFYHLEVQLPPITYQRSATRKAQHYFDLRITFRDGYRRAIFARNETSLRSQKTLDEIKAIGTALPQSFADDMQVVSSADYPRPRRDNLRRIWFISQNSSDAADEHVFEIARSSRYRRIGDLVQNCDLPASEAMTGVLRLIGRGALATNWDAQIHALSRVWLP